MAWTYEQKFNTLTDGDLDGQDNWVLAGGSITVQTTTKYEGAKAVQSAGGAASDDYSRTITAISDGLVYVAMSVNGTVPSSHEPYFMLYSGTTRVVMIRFDSNGYIRYYTGGAFVDYSTYTTNQWYVLAIEFDDTNQPDKFRMKVHDGSSWGSWTSWVATQNAYSTINKIRIDHEGGSGINAFWDTITPTDPTPPPGPPPMSKGFIF